MAMRYLEEKITLDYDRKKCVGCGLCAVVCPRRVFRMKTDKAEIIEKGKCIECGACMSNCPSGAIKVEAGVGCAVAVLASNRKRARRKWMD